MTTRNCGLINTSDFTIDKNHYPYFTFRPAKGESKGIIFFIHGYAFDSSYHDFFANLVAEYDYYAVELPGHGITPVKSDRDLSPWAFADMVVNLIKKLDLTSINLIGHSMGGGIAMMVHHSISERIKNLILVCPMNSFGTTNIKDFLFNFNPKTHKEAEKFYEIVLYDKRWLEDEWAKFIIDQLLVINNEFAHELSVLKKRMASLRNIFMLKRAEKIKNTKTLLITSDYDHCINSKTTIFNLKKNIANLTVIKFEKSGHIPMFEELGKYTNNIISFIED